MLDAYFAHAILASYDIIRASPVAADMISGHNAAGRAQLESVQADKIKALADILSPHNSAIMDAGHAPEPLADYLHNAATGLRDNARSKQHLKQLLQILRHHILMIAFTDQR